MITCRDRRGITSIVEYTVTFFLVAAAGMAMTVFIKRAFQAHMYNARHYMINSLNSACDAACQTAANGVGGGYEPYYSKVNAEAIVNSDSQRALTGNSDFKTDKDSTGTFIVNTNDQNTSNSTSTQLAPQDAAHDMH